MRKSLIFVVFIFMTAFSGIFTVQAAEFIASGGVDSRDILNGSVISDNPVARVGVTASYDSGWCAEVTGAVDLDDTSRNQTSVTACHNWEFEKTRVSAGVTYLDVWGQSAVRPYIKASMPVFNENTTIFAEAQSYLAENDANDGSVITAGVSYTHPFMGAEAKHMLSATKNNSSYAGSREGRHLAYTFSPSWNISKTMKLTPMLWGVDEEGKKPIGGASVNLSYLF